MASVILIGVGKKLFGVLVLLWLWRLEKRMSTFGRGGLIDSTFGRGGSGNYVDLN